MSNKNAPKVIGLLQQGLVFHQQGNLPEAQKRYARALKYDAVNPDAWHLLGVLLGARGQAADGIEHLQRAISLRPDFAVAYNNLGNAYRACRQSNEAISAYRKALLIRPDYAAALNNLGCILKAPDQLAEAVAVLRRVVALDPDYAEAFYNLANVYVATGALTEATTAYRRGLALKPDDVEMLLGLAKCLHRQGQKAEAIVVVKQSLVVAPDCADAYNTLGAFQDIEEQRATFQKAVDLAPNSAEAHLNLGAVELCLGDFDAGWQNYAYRPPQQGVPDPLAFAQRQVSLPALEGKSVCLYAEQGLGDTLQFSRYALMLAESGSVVSLVVQAPLKPLLEECLPKVRVFAKGEPLPAADEHCPLMSLPLVFGTTLSSIPGPGAYWAAPPDRVLRWANYLPPADTGKLRIGVAWSGNPLHENDQLRSIPLALFSVLMTRVEAHFFGLQTELRATDKALIPTLANLIDLSCEISDCADTASIMAGLDLIITVDTSVAHLAGAMGKPVWVLLPFAQDWRWLLDRNDSPWYPTMRLFRQTTTCDWLVVLESVIEALQSNGNGMEAGIGSGKIL
jgi:tetratricopeptide (TPR) repeat protein